jgi:ABC-2 type transport system ATP-binding protein
MGEPLIVENLRKSYGSAEVLAGVDLRVAAGEIVALLGPNGAGKTTLVSIVAALLKPDSGRVLVNGVDPQAQPRQARRHLGIAPQETGLYMVLTARENLCFSGELGGMGKPEIERRILEVAEIFELSPFLDRRINDLSGGEKRRLHTAMALLHNPPLLLLDEPTVGMDVETRTRLLKAIGELASAGSAILYSTHYLAEVEELDASVAILDRGRVIARDTVRRLVGSYGRPRVELVAPNLESVFLKVTGRSFASGGTLNGNDDVAA